MNVRYDAPMEMLGKSPEKIPNQKGENLGSDFEFRISKNLEEPEKNGGDGDALDIMVGGGKLPDITVSLSGKKDVKSVTNWMRKHMEAYPETVNGFFVKFIDDDQAEGYLVLPCDDDEKGEKINGVSYEISPYIFGLDSGKTNEMTETTKREMLEIFKGEKLNGDNSWGVDKTERMNKNKE